MHPLRLVRQSRSRGLMAVIGAAIVGIVAACGPASPDWTAPPTSDFHLSGGNYWHQRYSALDQVNAANVGELGGAWMTRLEEGGPGGQLEGTPIVVDGIMYVLDRHAQRVGDRCRDRDGQVEIPSRIPGADRR